MSREKLIELARGHLHHAVNGTVPLAETVVEIPVQNYFNEDRWKAEMELIFGRVPLVLRILNRTSENLVIIKLWKFVGCL